MNVCVVIPAYNEEKTIASVINSLPDDVNVIVVDDGSIDNTAEQVKKTRATLIQHEQNLGYCAAIQTGLRACQSDIFITLDGDGQHSGRDVVRLLDVILETGADLVLGSRFLASKRKNLYEIVVERLFSAVIFLVCGKWLSDCSCGLKAFRSSLSDMIPPMRNRAGWHQLICVAALRNRLKVVEVPVTVTSRKNGVSKVSSPAELISFILQVITVIINYSYRRKK